MDEQKPYVYQPYPRQKFHRTGKTVVVNDADAEAALGEGWRDSPNDPFEVPESSDPLRWFDSWGLQQLSPDAKARIKAGLVDAHADVVASRGEEGSRVRQASIEKAFDLFAKEFLAAGVLTKPMMLESIPQCVYDAAVSGGWETGALERNSGCTLQFGNYWVPDTVPMRLRKLFAVQALRWQAKVFIHPVSPATQSAESSAEPKPKTAQLKQPISKITTKAADLPTRRHGFRANTGRHNAIAQVVEQHCAGWRTGSRSWANDSLLRICADLDQSEIDIPPNWRIGKGTTLNGIKLTSWGEALELGYKKLVTDQIRYSLDVVLKAGGNPKF